MRRTISLLQFAVLYILEYRASSKAAAETKRTLRNKVVQQIAYNLNFAIRMRPLVHELESSHIRSPSWNKKSQPRRFWKIVSTWFFVLFSKLLHLSVRAPRTSEKIVNVERCLSGWVICVRHQDHRFSLNMHHALPGLEEWEGIECSDAHEQISEFFMDE